MNYFETISPERWGEKIAFWQSCDNIVDRATVAKALGLSPNRVSELVGLGALDVVSLKPLRFALEHSKGCYRAYQQWLRNRRRGERYCDDEFSDKLEAH
jgi:hypothetical protein